MQAIAILFTAVFPIYNCYIITNNFTVINRTDLVVITFNKVVLPWIHPVIITFDNTIVSMNSITISFNSIIVSENIITISMNDIFISRNIIILTFIYIFSLYRQKTNPCRQGQHSHQGAALLPSVRPVRLAQLWASSDTTTYRCFVLLQMTLYILFIRLPPYIGRVFFFRCCENHCLRQASLQKDVLRSFGSLTSTRTPQFRQ